MDVPVAEDVDVYAAQPPTSKQASEEQLIRLRAKIQAEHTANAVQRELERRFRKGPDSKSGWLG